MHLFFYSVSFHFLLEKVALLILWKKKDVFKKEKKKKIVHKIVNLLDDIGVQVFIYFY